MSQTKAVPMDQPLSQTMDASIEMRWDRTSRDGLDRLAGVVARAPMTILRAVGYVLFQGGELVQRVSPDRAPLRSHEWRERPLDLYRPPYL